MKTGGDLGGTGGDFSPELVPYKRPWLFRTFHFSFVTASPILMSRLMQDNFRSF